MLARLTSGIALASIAALVLVGCTPEPPTDDEVAVEVTSTFDGFFKSVDSLYAAGMADAAALEEYATPGLAEVWATDVQSVIDSGVSTRGTPTITNVALTGQAESAVSAAVCTDLSDVETTLADGSTPEGGAPVAWDARFVRTDSATLLLDSLEPTADLSVCGS